MCIYLAASRAVHSVVICKTDILIDIGYISIGAGHRCTDLLCCRCPLPVGRGDKGLYNACGCNDDNLLCKFYDSRPGKIAKLFVDLRNKRFGRYYEF